MGYVGYYGWNEWVMGIADIAGMSCEVPRAAFGLETSSSHIWCLYADIAGLLW